MRLSPVTRCASLYVAHPARYHADGRLAKLRQYTRPCSFCCTRFSLTRSPTFPGPEFRAHLGTAWNIPIDRFRSSKVAWGSVFLVGNWRELSLFAGSSEWFQEPGLPSCSRDVYKSVIPAGTCAERWSTFLFQ